MALVIRTVNQKIFWEQGAAATLGNWLGPNDLAADALKSLNTDDNCLSIFVINNLSSPDLDRVLAALAANRPNLDKLDYTVFDLNVVSQLGITTTQTPGDTPDDVVNSWHQDLTHLTATTVANLGMEIKRSAIRVGRKSAKEIRILIRQGVASKHIEPTKLKSYLAEKVLNSTQ